MQKISQYLAICLASVILIITASIYVPIASAKPRDFPSEGVTYVRGIITGFVDPIKGADVYVTCHHDGTDYSKSTEFFSSFVSPVYAQDKLGFFASFKRGFSRVAEGLISSIKKFSPFSSEKEPTPSIPRGYYLVSFPVKKCDTGDIVDVTAEKDGMSGFGSGVVEDLDGNKKANINVAVGNVSIPEFGLLTGVLTLISSVGTFYVVKRH